MLTNNNLLVLSGVFMQCDPVCLISSFYFIKKNSLKMKTNDLSWALGLQLCDTLQGFENSLFCTVKVNTKDYC